MKSRWATVQGMYADILAQVGNPPIELLTPTEYAARTGHGLGNFYGMSNNRHNVITVRKSRPDADVRNTLWHEIAHILFPSKPHWWIECFAAVMAPTDDVGRYATRYAKTPADMPSKAELLRLARLSAARLRKEDAA